MRYRVPLLGSSNGLLLACTGLSPAIHRDLTIDCYSDKPIGLSVFELHNLMAFPCQLSPPARLFGILFNRLVSSPVQGE